MVCDFTMLCCSYALGKASIILWLDPLPDGAPKIAKVLSCLRKVAEKTMVYGRYNYS